MAKSRVASLKPVTIPRLELTAALVSVRIGVILLKELEYEQITEVFWTYSKVVIGYIVLVGGTAQISFGNHLKIALALMVLRPFTFLQEIPK